MHGQSSICIYAEIYAELAMAEIQISGICPWRHKFARIFRKAFFIRRFLRWRKLRWAFLHIHLNYYFKLFATRTEFLREFRSLFFSGINRYVLGLLRRLRGPIRNPDTRSYPSYVDHNAMYHCLSSLDFVTMDIIAPRGNPAGNFENHERRSRWGFQKCQNTSEKVFLTARQGGGKREFTSAP